MSKKIKLGKEIVEQLQRIADFLPKIPTTKNAGNVSVTITGSKAKEIKMDTSSIPNIQDNVQYLAGLEDFVCINHFKALKKIWVEKGQAGIDEYVERMKGKNLELMDAKVEAEKNPPSPEEIGKRKEDLADKFEQAGKKRKPRMSGNKNTSKKSK